MITNGLVGFHTQTKNRVKLRAHKSSSAPRNVRAIPIQTSVLVRDNAADSAGQSVYQKSKSLYLKISWEFFFPPEELHSFRLPKLLPSTWFASEEEVDIGDRTVDNLHGLPRTVRRSLKSQLSTTKISSAKSTNC